MKRATILILAVLFLGVASKTRADTPNAFNPAQLSSDAIVAAVFSCEESAKKSFAQAKQKASTRFIQLYCGCITDAMRERNGPGAVTIDDLRFCAQWAMNQEKLEQRKKAK